MTSGAHGLDSSRDVQSAFGRCAKACRTERGLTLRQLGERASLHYAYISGIERGKRNPALSNICRLISGLGCEFGEFFEMVQRELSRGDP